MGDTPRGRSEVRHVPMLVQKAARGAVIHRWFRRRSTGGATTWPREPRLEVR